MRPIAISLSPNVQMDDVWVSVKTLLNPHSYFGNRNNHLFESDFEKMFGSAYKALSVGGGRSALYLILKSLGLKSGDEVLTQAFSCIAVSNSIIWSGAKPIYIDIDESYNIDPIEIAKSINKKTRAIIIQNTFGIVAKYDEILKTIKSAEKKYGNKIYVIEDCAHSLGSLYKNKKVGTVGDIAFFSFGRDKILSSVFGGMILVPEGKLYSEILKLQSELRGHGFFWEVSQLLHPIIFSLLILPLYNFGFGKLTLGKVLLLIFQKIGLLSMPITKQEKYAKKPKTSAFKMSNSLAALAIWQLKKLEEYNVKRNAIADRYFKELADFGFDLPATNGGKNVWLRFPIRHKKAKEILSFAKKRKLLLGNWYKGVIEPATDLNLVNYKKGMCPVAEKYSSEIINLPTYPALRDSDLSAVLYTLRKWKNTKYTPRI